MISLQVFQGESHDISSLRLKDLRMIKNYIANFYNTNYYRDDRKYGNGDFMQLQEDDDIPLDEDFDATLHQNNIRQMYGISKRHLSSIARSGKLPFPISKFAPEYYRINSYYQRRPYFRFGGRY